MSAPDQDDSLAQFNLGERSRIAGRDYYESRIPDSIKVYLATTPSDRLDEEAVDNERLFYYRFGVDVPRPIRQQVIDIKRRYGLTDAECRWLRRSGQFQMRRNEAKLVRDRWVPAAAWFYALTLALVFSSMLLVIGISAAPPWKQALGMAVIAALWMGSLWVINRLFLAPWRWLRLIGLGPR